MRLPPAVRRLTPLAVYGILLGCLGSTPAFGNTPADYQQLDASKALAVSTTDAGIFGIAADQPNDVAAATRALRRCDARRGAAGVCEIVRINDETVTRAADILAALPERPHPLYLWRYQGPRATVFLAGSIHLLKASLYPLPMQYEQAFAAATRLVVEVDINAYTPQDVQQQTLRYATLPTGQRLSGLLPEPLLQRLHIALDRYGLDSAAVDGLKPSLLMNQLVVARLLTLGYLPEFGVDQHFLARRGSREVLQLETLDSQLTLLFEQPLPVQIQLLADTLEQAEAIEPQLAGMLIAWRSGDDARLEALFDAQNGDSALVREFMEAVLDRRNHAMAERIAGFIENGQGTYFVLVGAAHHLGEAGIPALLAVKGLQGRRITSDAPAELFAPAAMSP